MLQFGNKEFRNLEEQVGKNAQDIQDFKDGNQTIAEFGITVVGILKSALELPDQGENYGDAYLIGTQAPYDMRVWTRDVDNNTAKWVDLGQFPLAGPKGDKGDVGSIIMAGQGEPSNNPTSAYQYYINTVTGYWYKSQSNPDGFMWVKSFTLKGEKGDRGEQGKQGVQGLKGDTGAIGPIGPQGQKGEKGDVGPAFNVQGTVASTANLPIPTAEMQDKGYAYLIPDTEGVKHVWVIQGPEGGPFQWVDVGAAGVGVQGPAGTNGIGLNTLTDTNLTLGDTTVQYSTDEGISVNSTMRQTFDGTNHDSMVDFSIPITGVDGITIDKADNAEKIEISGKGCVQTKNALEGQAILYLATNGNPNDAVYMSLTKTEYTVPRRYAGGQIEVGDPEGDSDAVPKKYAEANFVKAIIVSDGTYCYAANSSGPNQRIGVDINAGEYSLAERYDAGRLRVGTPVDNADAVNLQYFNANALTANSVKTLFGNKSIVGSGNIDLFNHDIKITGTDSSINGVYEVHVFKTSSNNLNVNSLTDLKTLLGNTFKYWNVNGSVQNQLDSMGWMALYVTESSVVFQPTNVSTPYTISLAGATFTDDVTTV